MVFCANPKEQYQSYRDEINCAIQRVLDNGRYVLGEEVNQFEREFSEFNNVSHTIGVGSGTEALHIALRALEIGLGDEVITTAHTAVATASAIDMVGAKPVFVDIEPDFFTIDPQSIEDAITSKTKAIIPVHIYGQPCDMDAIMRIAKNHDLQVIEDCAQAHGATYKDKRVGTMGAIGCFSFYPTKNLGAIGDGGALITNNKFLSQRIRLMREYGWKERFNSSEEGWNSRLDELQAAILRVKLKNLDKDNNRRIKNSCIYNNQLSDIPVVLPKIRDFVSHVYHLYVVKTEYRNQLNLHLKDHGINTTIQYPVPIHIQKYYKDKIGNISLPVTENTARNIISLPMYPELRNKEIHLTINRVKSYYGQ